MKTFFLITFMLFKVLSLAQTTVALKVIGSNRYITFYKDESLKQNKNGEVLSGTLVIDNMFFPQGSNLNIAFKQGSVITFNATGKVINGTVASDYNFRTETGIFKTFSSGDEVAFNTKGQVTKEGEKENTINYGEICIYNSIPFYCKTIRYDAYNDKYVTSGIVAKGNVEFIVCGGSTIKAKKNTEVELFPSRNYPWVINDDNAVPAWKELNNCLAGTVEKITIDKSYKFLVWGCAYEVEFPVGSEIEFEPHVIKPVFSYLGYNLVISAKLGKDAMIPTLGLVKKGKTVRAIHTFKEGLQIAHGYLTVE